MTSAVAAVFSTLFVLGLFGATPPSGNLGDVLADPPSSDYQAVPNGGTGNFGPQDQNTIAASATDGAAAKLRLTKDEFTRGYEKGWVQPSTGMVLVEGVYEFKLDSGARDYFGASKTGDSANHDFKGFFDTPGVSPAYGAHFLSSDGFPSDAVVFVKGNLNLVVVMGNRSGVDSSKVLAQAKAQLAFAPDNTLPQPGSSGSGSGSGSPSAPLWLGIFTGAVLVVAVLIGLIALFLRRRSSGPAPAPATSAAMSGPPPAWLGVGPSAAPAPTPAPTPALSPSPAPAPQPPALTLSGDGRYWWDGAGWQDTETSAPPGAQRSPDGAYWYDGSGWRPVPGWHPR